MKKTTLFSRLFSLTLDASGSHDAIDLFLESLFGSYFDKPENQLSYTQISSIVRGERTVPRSLMKHYWDPDHPRCPRKLQADLTALVYCLFFDTVRSRALRHALADFLTVIPEVDAEDLRQIISTEDLPQFWTVLTWYTLCVDTQKD